jgi:hypothetical protein
MIVHPNGLEDGALLLPRDRRELEILSELRQERRIGERSVGRYQIQFKNGKHLVRRIEGFQAFVSRLLT